MYMYLHSIQHLRHKLQTFVLELHQVNLKFSLFHWNHCIDRNKQQHEAQTCKQKDQPPISLSCTHQMLLKPMSNKWSDNHFKIKYLESFLSKDIYHDPENRVYWNKIAYIHVQVMKLNILVHITPFILLFFLTVT